MLAAILVSGACVGYLAFTFTAGIRFLGWEGVVWQRGAYDCGPAALQMIFSHFRIDSDYLELTRRLETASGGTSMLRLKRAAEARGLRCSGWRLSTRDLRDIPLPAILFMRRNHFVVLDSQTPAGALVIRDPARGRLLVTARRFASVWDGEALLFTRPGAGKPPDCRWFDQASVRGPR